MRMGNSTRLWLSGELADKIRQQAAQTYPHECCGALLGHDKNPGASREVTDVLPLVNRRDDSPRNRYSVAALDVVDAHEIAGARGVTLIGWYHSHPDHPAKPSRYDRDHAWPWYSYVIVSVYAGVPGEMTSWRLNDDRDAYSEETVEICTEDARQPQA